MKYSISTYRKSGEVNYPAAELRGIKIQSLFPCCHSCGSRNPVFPGFSGLPLEFTPYLIRGGSDSDLGFFSNRRTCFYPPSRAGRYSTGIFIMEYWNNGFFRNKLSFVIPLFQCSAFFIFLSCTSQKFS